jgi:hypothetical protein
VAIMNAGAGLYQQGVAFGQQNPAAQPAQPAHQPPPQPPAGNGGNDPVANMQAGAALFQQGMAAVQPQPPAGGGNGGNQPPQPNAGNGNNAEDDDPQRATVAFTAPAGGVIEFRDQKIAKRISVVLALVLMACLVAFIMYLGYNDNGGNTPQQTAQLTPVTAPTTTASAPASSPTPSPAPQPAATPASPAPAPTPAVDQRPRCALVRVLCDQARREGLDNEAAICARLANCKP